MKVSARGHHRIDEADVAGPQPELLRAQVALEGHPALARRQEGRGFARVALAPTQMDRSAIFTPRRGTSWRWTALAASIVSAGSARAHADGKR
ncbi:hypothetical protein GCM10009733_056670 [Nonomuraea maheshkhaliensis]|uniref:Uncharacterized protein n=1 Tax=Nonomuraea maheshkhaliensis TaxID=419590 RepID=A0ABN2FL93_9ACTN